QTAYQDRKEGCADRFSFGGRELAEVFLDLFVKRNRRGRSLLEQGPGSRVWPICEPSPFQLLYLAEGVGEQVEARTWANRLIDDPTASIPLFFQSEFHRSGASYPHREQDLTPRISPSQWLDILGRRVPVLIDMDVTLTVSEIPEPPFAVGI